MEVAKKTALQPVADFDRQVPYAQEAELCVLGAMLMDREAIAEAIEMLDARCFYIEAHRKLFSAIVALFEKSVEVDPVTLCEQLASQGALEEVGGRSFVGEIYGAVPTSANISYHAQIVRQKSMLRRLIESCTAIIQEAYQPVENVDRVIDSAEERIFQIQEFRLKEGFTLMQPIIHHIIINDLEQRQKNKVEMTGLPTGFRDLDRLTVGFQKSELVIVAGRPSMGKTSLSLNIALSLACETKFHPERVPVAIFSLEMSKEQLVQRFLCSQAQVSLTKMRNARLTDLEWYRLQEAANLLFEAPIFIDDTPEINVLEIRAKSRRLQKTDKIGMIIVDYLQLMRVPGRVENRQQEISLISRSLKALAKELNIPVIALSQLSRAVEGRQDRRPQLSDLRESGAIEQDADLVLFIYRPEVYDIKESEGRSMEGIAEVIVGKNRNGPTGIVELLFVKEFTRFENLSFREEMEGK